MAVAGLAGIAGAISYSHMRLLAANVAAAGAGPAGRVIAGWPAFALLVAVKLAQHQVFSVQPPAGPRDVSGYDLDVPLVKITGQSAPSRSIARCRRGRHRSR